MAATLEHTQPLYFIAIAPTEHTQEKIVNYRLENTIFYA
jgi:hypothetical protein